MEKQEVNVEKVRLQLDLIRVLNETLEAKIAVIENIKTQGLVEDLSKPISLLGSPLEQEELNRIKMLIIDTAEDICVQLNHDVIPVIIQETDSDTEV
jgi:hypothetical protein